MLSGVEEFDRVARELARELPRQAGGAAVNAGLAVFVRAYQRASPTGGKGGMRRSAGKRFKQVSGGDIAGKAGYDVGKRRRGGKWSRADLLAGRAPHSHLYVKGTRQRRRKRIGGKWAFMENPPGPNIEHKRRTGAAPSHEGQIASSVSASIPAALAAMLPAARKKLDQLAQQKGI